MKTFITSQDNGFKFKLKNVLENPNSRIEEITEVLKADTQLSALILKVANNPLYGFSGSIDNLARAIALLGVGQVHELLLRDEVVLPKKTSVNLPPLPAQNFMAMEWRFV